LHYKNNFNSLHHRTAHFHCTVESIEREGIVYMIFKWCSLGTTIRKMKGGSIFFQFFFHIVNCVCNFFMDMFLHAYFFYPLHIMNLFSWKFFSYTLQDVLAIIVLKSTRCMIVIKNYKYQHEHQGIPNLQSGL
jgi:hypothetical protein